MALAGCGEEKKASSPATSTASVEKKASAPADNSAAIEKEFVADLDAARLRYRDEISNEVKHKVANSRLADKDKRAFEIALDSFDKRLFEGMEVGEIIFIQNGKWKGYTPLFEKVSTDEVEMLKPLQEPAEMSYAQLEEFGQKLKRLGFDFIRFRKLYRYDKRDGVFYLTLKLRPVSNDYYKLNDGGPETPDPLMDDELLFELNHKTKGIVSMYHVGGLVGKDGTRSDYYPIIHQGEPMGKVNELYIDKDIALKAISNYNDSKSAVKELEKFYKASIKDIKFDHISAGIVTPVYIADDKKTVYDLDVFTGYEAQTGIGNKKGRFNYIIRFDNTGKVLQSKIKHHY